MGNGKLAYNSQRIDLGSRLLSLTIVDGGSMLFLVNTKNIKSITEYRDGRDYRGMSAREAAEEHMEEAKRNADHVQLVERKIRVCGQAILFLCVVISDYA